MTQRDLHNTLKVKTIIPPIVGNNTGEGTPADGSGLDTRGFDSAELIAVFGDSGDTLSASVKVDLVLQHADADADGGYAAVTDANAVLIGASAGVTAPDGSGIVATIDAPAEDTRHFRIGYRGPKRFCRLKFVFTGTHSNGVPMAQIGVLSHGGGPQTD